MNEKLSQGALALTLCMAAAGAIAEPVGYGAATTGGGAKTPIVVTSLADAQARIDAYTGGGLVLLYIGKFNYATITDVCAQWRKPAQTLEIKNKSASNVIVQNMTIGLLQGGEAADSVSIEGMSSGKPSNIWIDHNTIFASLTMCSGAGDASFDGGIDMKKGAHHITVSYNYVHDYQKVALNGYSDSDTANAGSLTTYHHNRFENVKSRLPLLRFGKAHIYNNYFGNVHASAINVRMGALALIEANYFENVVNPVTSRDSDYIGYWELRDNYVGTGISWTAASGVYANATNWTTTKTYGAPGYRYTAETAGNVKARALVTAGAHTNLAQ
jgi:pectate lyase